MNTRIAKWALVLQSYDYTLQHRHGISMGHVDALSRLHPKDKELSSSRNDPSYLKDAVVVFESLICDGEMSLCVLCRTIHVNDRDERIVRVRDHLEEGPLIGFEMKDGLVFKIDENGRHLLYVANEMEENVILLMHEKLGYLGVDKTFEGLRRYYCFPGVTEKVSNFIRNCLRCIMHAAPVQSTERTVHSIEKKPEPFDTLHLDHFRPLPSVNYKRKHKLLVTDAFTKFVKIYAVNSTSAKEVIASFEKYFAYYSRPRRIITDQGTCFTLSSRRTI